MKNKGVADIPPPQPGLDTLNMSMPLLLQLNPEGKWDTKKPAGVEEKKLQNIVQHLMDTKIISTAHSCCSQCAREGQISGMSSKNAYIPIILMPIPATNNCPFDLDCVTNAKTKSTKEKLNNKQAKDENKETSATKTVPQKQAKRTFVLQRFTDFDLLSQW